MTRKQTAALVTALIALLGTLAAAVSGLHKSDSVAERVRVVEVRNEGLTERLQRMESKLDRLIERGR